MQAAGLLMVMMLISRILGYVRDVVLLSSFGQDFRTDAYYAAFNIPDFIYSVLLGGALGSAFTRFLRSIWRRIGRRTAGSSPVRFLILCLSAW